MCKSKNRDRDNETRMAYMGETTSLSMVPDVGGGLLVVVRRAACRLEIPATATRMVKNKNLCFEMFMEFITSGD